MNLGKKEKEKRKEGQDLKRERVRGRSEADGLSAEARKNGRRGEMKDGGTRCNTNCPPLVCLFLDLDLLQSGVVITCDIIFNYRHLITFNSLECFIFIFTCICVMSHSRSFKELRGRE